MELPFTQGNTHCVNSPILTQAMSLVNIFFITDAAESSEELKELLDEFTTIQKMLEHEKLMIGGEEVQIVTIPSCDEKMHAILVGHGGQAYTYFSSYHLHLTLDSLKLLFGKCDIHNTLLQQNPAITLEKRLEIAVKLKQYMAELSSHDYTTDQIHQKVLTVCKTPEYSGFSGEFLLYTGLKSVLEVMHLEMNLLRHTVYCTVMLFGNLMN